MTLSMIDIFACLYPVSDCIVMSLLLSACLCLCCLSAQPWIWVLDFRQPNPACYPRRHLKPVALLAGQGCQMQKDTALSQGVLDV